MKENPAGAQDRLSRCLLLSSIQAAVPVQTLVVACGDSQDLHSYLLIFKDQDD